MKIILVMVSSINGKTTNGKDSSENWASKEDQDHFFSLINENNLIVMGSNTYQQAQSKIKHSPDKLRIVMTRNPQQFNNETIPDQLEFTNESPNQLVKRLESQGYSQLLLVSGAILNTEFFKQKLINELYLTIEPKIFASGKGIIDESGLNINLELISSEKLNDQGTLLLKYKVQ